MSNFIKITIKLPRAEVATKPIWEDFLLQCQTSLVGNWNEKFTTLQLKWRNFEIGS
jgi:hypothetical protein